MSVVLGGIACCPGRLVHACAPHYQSRLPFHVSFDGGGSFAFSLLGRLLVILAPTQLGEHTRLLAGALEAPQGGIEVLTFSYTNAWHLMFRGDRKIDRLTPALNRSMISLRMGSCKDSARVAALKVLGIETSCDETGIAIYDPAEGLVGEALFSQSATHARFGGVVPELASRDHIARSAPMLCQVVADAGLTLQDLDAIAYTAGPGLVGALMVGGSLAASLAFGLGIPAIPIHHLEAHLLVARLEEDPPDFPFLALLVSGGHTLLVHVQGLGAYRTVGNTLDDAAGEAFDKVARLLSLPYPGGPALEELAAAGDPQAFDFPRPMKNRGLDFSFSGLKTAVRLKLESESARAAANVVNGSLRANIAASFQAAVVDTLVHKSVQALATTGLDRLVVAGGVGANEELRQRLRAAGEQQGFRVYYPRPAFCTDNGAMIAYAGWCRHGTAEPGAPRILARPRWPLDELAVSR